MIYSIKDISDNVALIKKLFNNVEANWIELKEGYLYRICRF